MGVMIALLLLLSTVAVGQDDRIKVFISVSSHPENSVITQLGNDLKEEFIDSRKYNLVSISSRGRCSSRSDRSRTGIT